MLELNFNPFPVISTNRLVLRRIEKKDVNEIFFLRSDESVMKYIDRPRARSLDDAQLFINKIDDLIAGNDGIMWAVTMKNDPKLIGNICYWNIEKEHYRAETGYVLHPDFHGKGLMGEALLAVIDYGFNIMKLHSISANVNPANTSSMTLLERNGFIREAYFRENYYYDGKFIDSAIYCLVNTDERIES